MTNLFTYLSNWKRKYICTLVVLLCLGVGNAWGTDYSMTMDQNANKGTNDVHITNTTANSYQDVTHSTVTWRVAWAGTGVPTSGSKTQVQFGTASYPCTSVTLSTSGISGTITSVALTCYGANDNGSTVSVQVGSSDFTSGGNTSVALGTGALSAKTFTGSASGTITITVSQPSTSKAIYISGLSVTYSAASCTTNPTVTGSGKGSVTSTTATLTCSSGISSLGSAGCSISSYGFVMNTTGTPTISDTKLQVGTTYTTTGTSFSKNLTDLTPGTTYYVRSYATNGNGTAYGSQTNFTTKNRYNLTFKETDGTNNGSGTVVEDSTAIRITSAPSKDYYDLEGFYTTSGLGTKIATAAGALQNGSGSGITVGGNAWTNGSSQWKRGAGETFYLNWTPKDYAITTTLSNCSWSSAISSPYTYDGSSDPITRTVNPSSGYTCPPNITVTMGGSTLTKGTDYTWSVNGTTGVGSFTLNKVITGAVAITITAEQLFTVTFNKGTGTCATSSLKGTNAAGVTLPTPTHHCDGWSFAGWTTGSLITTETGSAPATLYTGGSTYKPSADITLYAVYKHGDAKYHLVTTLPTGDDIAGNYMVVNTSNKKAMDAFVTSSYYLDKESISAITDNAINYADAGTYKHYTKWEVSYSSSAWHFYNTYTSKYLYNYVSSTNHYLGINSTKQNGYDLSLSSGYAVFTSKDDVGAHIYWDDSNSRFAATTGSTNNLHLYKEDPLVYFSNPSCCTPHDISRAGTPAGTVTGGTFTVNKASACEDAEVTLTATPSSKEYVFNAWTVTETADPTNDITSTNVDGNTLTMPDFAVTVSASFSAISSIVVKTAPTKTTYCAGDNFNPAGLVVTATYANSATQDISYASDAALFTFSPATDASLATNNSSVSITVGGQSTSQAITVNAVRTISLTGSGTVTGGTFTSDESSACVGATITLTPSASSHYTFTSWTITKAGGGTVTPDGNTFTMPDDNVTVNATFTEDAHHFVTFKNDLTAVSGYDHVKVYDGTKPTPPTMTDVTDACDKSECTLFYGWIAEAGIWDETLDDISAKTIYRNASDLPNVSGADVTYHAVWAKGTTAPAVSLPTPVVAWNKQSFTSGSGVSANTGTGTMTTNIGLSSEGVYTYSGSVTSGVKPLITLSGLNLSSYSNIKLSFYARSSQSYGIKVTYSTDNGSSYKDLSTTSNLSSSEKYFEVSSIPSNSTNIKLEFQNSTSGASFFFGTVKIYEGSTTNYTFTELTSSNTSGWTGSDWDGDYMITHSSTTSVALDGWLVAQDGTGSVSPSEGIITASGKDAGMAFHIAYNSSEGKYTVKGIGANLYMKAISGNKLTNSSSVEYMKSIAYNGIVGTVSETDYTLKWGSTSKCAFYTSSQTAIKLYKTLSTYTKWRINCCEKNDITKDGSGTVTGGTFTVDKTSACEGATVTMSVTSTSSGYNFDHWEVTGDDSSDEITVTDNTFEMPNEAVTVTAVFETAHTTTVTLNAQGGSSGTSSVTATVNLPMPDATMPTKTGYSFDGYYLATNGSGTQYYDADGNSAHDWDNGEDATEVLYAKWVASGYTVTLNTEGATTQGTASVSVTYGANTNLTSAITCPTYTNKVFGGYWTTASGEGTQLIDGDGNWIPNVTSYTGSNKQWLYANDIELHARWSNVSYTNYRTTCGPEIEVTVSGTVRLTAYAGCEVLTPSTSLITVSSDDWKSKADALTFLRFRLKDKVSGVTYSHTSSSDEGSTQKIANSEFRVYHASGNGGSYADNGYISIPAGTTDSTFSFRIAYTPTSGSYNTTDHYILEVEAMDNSGTKKTITLELLDLYGRTLPQEFVVAVKKDGNWYALPNNLPSTSTAAKATAAIPIVVDNATTPTCAMFAPENVLYQATGYYTAPAVASRNRSGVRFTRNGSQYLQVSTKAGTNTMWLSTTGGADVQDWYLNSSNFQSYELKMDPRAGTGGYKDKKMGMLGSNFGFYSSPTAYDIYLLPVENTLEEARVVEWGTNSLILEVDAGGYSHVIARVGEEATGALGYSQTNTSAGSSSSKTYTINVGNAINFDEEADNLLYLDWLNSTGGVAAVSMIPIPWIINGTKTMSVVDATKGHWEKAEVHVLPSAVLTADAGTFSDVTIKQLEIYPGATVNVTTGTLTTTNLMLRNGWTRIGEKAYDAARLYIPSTGSLKATNVYADWYIDYDQYYPIAVPWKVATAGITYLNTSNSASGGVKLRYYDGNRRANGGAGDSNWKQYTWGYDMPEYLVPGIGYAMTAKRATGKAFSIVRMPLTLPAGSWTTGDWTTAGEAGSVEISEVTYRKDTVHVDAWGAEEKKPQHTVGWNFIANPYMAIYQGAITHSVDEDYDVEYVNIPDVNFKEFDQCPVGTLGQKLLPAGGFFIQTEKTGYLTFGTTNRKASTPSFRKEIQNLTTKQKAYIILNGEEDEDMMGLLVSDHYTADYDINGDLEKLMGDANSLKTYMQYGDLNMAYVAINEELAREWIPITVRIPENGEYTYSLHEASIADELEGVYLIDYENGDMITNLLDNNYTFYSPSGIISGRFAINAIVGQHNTPTDIDIINAGGDIHSDKPVKFIWNDKVFILHNGVIYDSTGKKVRRLIDNLNL